MLIDILFPHPWEPGTVTYYLWRTTSGSVICTVCLQYAIVYSTRFVLSHPIPYTWLYLASKTFNQKPYFFFLSANPSLSFMTLYLVSCQLWPWFLVITTHVSSGSFRYTLLYLPVTPLTHPSWYFPGLWPLEKKRLLLTF